MKKSKNIIIAALIIAIFIMSVGYSAFATTMNINGQAEITGEWDVKITDIKVQSVSEGSDAGTPEFTDTSATFNAKLNKPGDEITYLITIKNAGTINAKLNNVLFTSNEENSTEAITYETSRIANSLDANEETTFTVKVKYEESTTEPEVKPEITTKVITGIIEYVQK